MLGPKDHWGLWLPLLPRRPAPTSPPQLPPPPRKLNRLGAAELQGPAGEQGTEGKGCARSLWAGQREEGGRRASLHRLPPASVGARPRQRPWTLACAVGPVRAWERSPPPLANQKGLTPTWRAEQVAEPIRTKRRLSLRASGRAQTQPSLYPRPLLSAAPPPRRLLITCRTPANEKRTLAQWRKFSQEGGTARHLQ